MDPKAHHVSVLEKNMREHHQANIVIDPATGASLEYRNLMEVSTKAIRENLFAN